MAFLDNSGVTALVTRLKNYFALKTDIPTVPTAYTSNPAMDGTASAGSVIEYARGNHVHPHDTSRVPTSTTINGKALSSNITLSASDVGAQATLVSGTNIKTIDGESILGSGDITVSGGGTLTDEEINTAVNGAFDYQIENGSTGFLSVSTDNATVGETVTITVKSMTNDIGYSLTGWVAASNVTHNTFASGSFSYVGETASFTMPDYPVVVYASVDGGGSN